MSSLPNLTVLMGIAGGVGMALGCIMTLVNRERDGLANRSNFLIQAVEIMKAEPQVKQLLGDQIEVGRMTFTDGWSKMRRDNVQVRVPIKGEHDNAYLFVHARKKSENDKLRMFKLEATFEKIPNKKLIIMDRTDKEDLEDYVPKPKAEKPPEPKAKPERPTLTKEDFKEQMKSWAPK